MTAMAFGKNKKIARFLLDWAAVITLGLCFVVFTAVKGSSFMSTNNMINILRAMSITTVFGIAATGRRVHTTGQFIREIKEGKVSAEWQATNALGLMQQLGAIPAQG